MDLDRLMLPLVPCGGVNYGIRYAFPNYVVTGPEGEATVTMVKGKIGGCSCPTYQKAKDLRFYEQIPSAPDCGHQRALAVGIRANLVFYPWVAGVIPKYKPDRRRWNTMVSQRRNR